jgi:uncharacterized membrane protein YcaP (DUF421 family)
MRFMGKREIGKLSVFDLVISLMIAEIAVIVIEDPQKPLFHAVTPMLLLMLIQILMAFLSLKFRGLRVWFDGKPTILIAKGKLDRNAMRKQRYNLDDLMLQLRENKIASVNDVEFAILETSGKLSIIEKQPRKTVIPGGDWTQEEPTASSLMQPSDKKISLPPNYRYETVPIPLIMDGKVLDDNLTKAGKTRFWLKKELRDKGIGELKDVFLCTVDHKGQLFVDQSAKPKR